MAFLSGLHNWKIDTFIWTGKDLSIAMMIVGIMGLLGIVLAFFDLFRGLHPVMTLILFGLIVYGFFWQPYRFRDREEFQGVVALAVGAVGSFFCSLMLLKKRKR